MTIAPAPGTRRQPDDERLVIPAIDRDGSLYPMGKLEAHRRGQQHLAVSVFIFSKGKLLLQRRAATKYHSGGLWANTCCTHPHWGEGADSCARRRLPEEVGLDVDLHACGVVDYQADVGNGLFENERVHVFRGDLPNPPTAIPFNTDEVQDVAWLDPAALRRRVEAAPWRFTPWIRIYLDRWSELALGPAS